MTTEVFDDRNEETIRALMAKGFEPREIAKFTGLQLTHVQSVYSAIRRKASEPPRTPPERLRTR